MHRLSAPIRTERRRCRGRPHRLSFVRGFACYRSATDPPPRGGGDSSAIRVGRQYSRLRIIHNRNGIAFLRCGFAAACCKFGRKILYAAFIVSAIIDRETVGEAAERLETETSVGS